MKDCPLCGYLQALNAPVLPSEIEHEQRMRVFADMLNRQLSGGAG